MSAKSLFNARWAVLAVLFCLWQPCFAQFNSSVEGTVSDQTGAVVPNAQVTLHSAQTGVDLKTKTQGAGAYRFNAVGPGDYEVTFEAQGFAKKVVQAHVSQDQVASVNASLALPGSTAVVNVTSVADSLNPDETRVQTTLSAEQIENLPLQNGNVLETVKVAPGVTGIDEDRNLWAINIGASSMNASANGRPSGSNSYQLDGVSIESNSKGTGSSLNFVPAEDMVQEVALETSTYSVDNGASTSLIVNFTTKGGTNKYHGTFGDRYSGRGLNAVAYNSVESLPASRRWYTGSLGGPIWKDKTFFFFSYLHQTQITALSGATSYLDDDFTQNWAPKNYPNSVNVQNLLMPYPVGNAIKGAPQTYAKDMVSGGAAWQTGPNECSVPAFNLPFFLNGSPSKRTPIDCTQVVVSQGIFNQAPRVNGYQVDGRIDQFFRDGKDRVYASYLLEPQTSDFLWWRPKFNSTTPSATRYLNFNFTHIFNPNLLSQTAVSYMRYGGGFTPNQANVIPFLTLTLGAPNSATDYFGTPGPSSSKAHDYQLREDVTWTHNRHNVKVGLSAKHLDYYNDTSGFSSKANAPIYFSLSDLLDDEHGLWSYSLATLSGTTGKFLANISGGQVTQFGLYAQDDWKVRPNLLLTVGLRWDDFGNPSSYGKNALPYNVIQWSGGSITQALASNSLNTIAASNVFTQRQNQSFLPRVGFAWTPAPARKLTLHGGLGFYSDALNLQGVSRALTINSPSFLNESFGFFNPAPFNVLDPRGYYGTTNTAAPPYGNTFSFPSVTPGGKDSHGELLDTHGNIITSGPQGIDRKLRPSKTILYNVQAEKEIGYNIIFGVGYSASYSWDQLASGDYNEFVGDQILNKGKQKRLTSEWGGVSLYTNALSGNYNALLATIRQNYHRLSWQASYTWAKTLGNGGLIDDITQPKHYYGPSGVPNSFNATASYELPGRSLKNFYERAALGGWEISGIATAQAGTPFSMHTSMPFVPIANAPVSEGGSCTVAAKCTDITDPSKAGTYLANGVSNSLVEVPRGLKRSGFSRKEFETGIFSSLGYSTSGYTPTGKPGFSNPRGYAINPVYASSQGYNTFQGPGYLGVDSSLHKKVLLPWFGSETSTLTLGVEASNVLNRTNLVPISSSSSDGTDLANTTKNVVGVSTGAYQARVIQVTGKFQF